MGTSIFTILFIGSLIYNIKQYRDIQKCNGCETQIKPSRKTKPARNQTNKQNKDV